MVLQIVGIVLQIAEMIFSIGGIILRIAEIISAIFYGIFLQRMWSVSRNSHFEMSAVFYPKARFIFQ
jgi:hypothetical protein